MTSSHPTPAPCQWFSWLAAALDRRSAPRLALLFFGAVLAPGPADRHDLDQGGQAQRPVLSPATSPSRPPASGPIASPDAS
jgi:hypothetical protein